MATPQQVRRRGRWSLILGTVFAAVLFAAVAYADNVQNDVVVGGTDTIVAGGSTSIGYRIQQTGVGNDGQAGCNASDGSAVTITLSVPANVNATSSAAGWNQAAKTLTFNTCGDYKNVTFASSIPGNYAINVSNISDNGVGAYGNQANWTLHVNAPPNTAPSVSVTGVTHGATYEIGAVPAAGCSVTDAEDSSESATPTLSSISGPLALFGVGSQTASCSYTDGGGLSDSDSATYSVIDSANPLITFVNRTAANIHGWNNGSVTVNWSCSDSGTGVVAASVSKTVSAEGGNQSATGTCADNAGNAASDTQSGINIDLTNPTINGSASPGPNGNGWNNSDVTVSFTCGDSLSGIASCGPNQTLMFNGAGQSASGTALDKAGNSASATVSGINIDKLAPSVAYTSASPASNAAGWNNTNVTATFTATDTLSGFAPNGALTDTGTSIASAEGSNVTVGSPAFSDRAGNSAAAASATSDSFKIDKMAPTVTVTGVANGATYTLGSVPAADCSTSDGLSGVQTYASLSSTGGPVGSVTKTCTGGKDNADNVRTPVSVTYNVHYAWDGFFQPIDNGGVFNVAKAGSAIPVKFSLGGDRGMNIIASATAVTVTCSTSADADPIEEVVTASTSGLKYDATAGQYIYVWKTGSWANSCRRLDVKLDDGSTHSALFKFNK